MTYYVDSQKGDDQWNGTSAKSPWKTLNPVNCTVFSPGDNILFRAGGVYHGQLHPLGNGTVQNPISIGRYGDGPNPRIDGGGSHGTQEGNYTEGAAVLFFNQNYWELSDLDITNYNPYFKQGFEYLVGKGGGSGFLPSPNNRYRYGILVRWDNYGTGRHIYIRNCNIHDINGEMQRFTAEGILVVCSGTRGGIPTHFDDLLLEGNSISNIERTGISIWSAWAEGRGTDYPGSLSDTNNFYHQTVGAWKGSTNAVIRNNRVCRTAGDAILVNTTIGAIIEKNYVEHCCYEMRIGANAAVWPHNADGTILQENEVCFTHGVQDGQAFDIDLSCYNTTIRNNYSHDNEGGFLLLMNRTWNNEIYGNISENDCNGLIWYHENNGGTHIHDNLFYIGMEETQVFRGPYGSHDWDFVNNTFYCRKPETEIFWNETPIYRGNNYYNIANLPNDPDARSEQPDFVPSR